MERSDSDNPERREWPARHVAQVEIGLDNNLIEYLGRKVVDGLSAINGVVGGLVRVQEFSLTRFEREHRFFGKRGAGYEVKTKVSLGDIFNKEISEEKNVPRIVTTFVESAKKFGININIQVEEDENSDLGVKVDANCPLLAMIYPFLGKGLVKQFMEDNRIDGDVPSNLSEVAMVVLRFWKEKGIEISPGLRIKLDRLVVKQFTSDMSNDGLTLKITNEFENADGWLSQLGEPIIDGETIRLEMKMIGKYFIGDEATHYGVATNTKAVGMIVVDGLDKSEKETKDDEQDEFMWDSSPKEYGTSRRFQLEQEEELKKKREGLEKLGRWIDETLKREDIAEELIPQVFVKILESGLPNRRVTRLVKGENNILTVRTKNIDPT